MHLLASRVEVLEDEVLRLKRAKQKPKKQPYTSNSN